MPKLKINFVNKSIIISIHSNFSFVFFLLAALACSSQSIAHNINSLMDYTYSIESDSRTYILPRNWDIQKTVKICQRGEPKAPRSINVHCQAIEPNDNRLNENSEFKHLEDSTIEQNFARHEHRKKINTEVNFIHQGHVLIYSDLFRGQKVVKVKVYFYGYSYSPLPSETTSILFNNFANEFGLLQIINTDEGLAKIQASIESNQKSETKEAVEQEKLRAQEIAKQNAEKLIKEKSDFISKTERDKNRREYISTLKLKYSNKISSSNPEAKSTLYKYDPKSV